MLHSTLCFPIIVLSASWIVFVIAQEENVRDEMVQVADLLGLRPASARLKRQPTLSNSATKFLLEVYKEINDENEGDLQEVLRNSHKTRHTRSVTDGNFITPFDRREIKLCNNIITFASRPTTLKSNSALFGDMLLNFNLNDVPADLELTHAAVRLYQDPQLGRYGLNMPTDDYNTTISIYQPVGAYLLDVASVNASTDFRGWLELNVTHVFNRWLRLRTLQQTLYGNELLVGVTLHKPLAGASPAIKLQQIAAGDVGLIPTLNQTEMLDMQPFIIGYFNGPDLMTKMQQGSLKQHTRQVRHVDTFRRQQQPSFSHSNNEAAAYEQPKACERRNFTLDFKYLGMEKSVIAPKTFEAYFCLGECNFPLGTPMSNATNHAIMQTLIHLKRPHLPKPCCVPIKLASISILYSVNDDSVNLMRFSQIVAKECGCR